MGGKVKQSQRTKNNARPSSSGRSAVLLSNVITPDSVFGSAGISKPLPASFPSMSTTNIDQGLTNEFSLAFKKLNKKDPITRTKALQELIELIKHTDCEDVVAALPRWSQVYLALTIDSERKVRALTQVCHGEIVSKCGRQVAPQVRRILPPWLLAVHDEYGPAQTTAEVHLHKTFPDHKLVEAITFCKSEILTLIIENLTGKVEAILSKKLESEERSSQVSRVVASSLRALQLCVDRLPRELDEWLAEATAPALSDNAFWNLATDPSPHVRGSWYLWAGSWLRRGGARAAAGGARAAAGGARAAAALLGRAERHAPAAPLRAAALLALLRHVSPQDLAEWIKKKDLLVKRFLEILEYGCWGEASLLNNTLVPVLGNLSADLVTKEFYPALFDALFTGLEDRSILGSKSERQLWITILCDCLCHLSEQKQDYVVEVVTHVHRTWLEKIFAIGDDQTRIHLIKYSATKMVTIVQYWIQRSSDTNENVYDKLTRNFWQSCGATAELQVHNLPLLDADIARLINDHASFIKSFKTPSHKKKRITFEGEVIENTVIEPAHDKRMERYEHSLNDFVIKVLGTYFEFAENKQMSSAVFTNLWSTLVELDTKQLFQSLAQRSGSNSLFSWYDGVLKRWVCSDTMRCKALVEIIFAVSKYFSDEELESMYNSFQLLSPISLDWCIEVATAQRARRGADRRWLGGAVVESAVRARCARARSDPAAARLVAWLAQQPELLWSEGATDAVAEWAGRRGRGQAARVCRALARSQHARRAAPLLLHLFTAVLRSDTPPTTTDSSEDTDHETATSADVMRLVRQQATAELVKDAVGAVQNVMLQRLDKFDVRFIERTVSLCPYLVREGADVADHASLARQLFNIDVEESQLSTQSHALLRDCLYGNLNCLFDDNPSFEQLQRFMEENSAELTKSDFIPYLYKVAFKALYLRKLLRLDDEVAPRDWFSEEYFKLELLQVCHASAVVKSLYDGYSFMYHDVLREAKQLMDDVLRDVVTNITERNNTTILELLTQKSQQLGYYWAYAKLLYEITLNRAQSKYDNSKESESSVECNKVQDELDKTQSSAKSDRVVSTLPEFDSLMLEKIVRKNGFFHSLQASENLLEQNALRTRYLVLVRGWYAAHAGRGAGGGGPGAERARAFASRAAAALAGNTPDPDPVIDDFYAHDDAMFTNKDFGSASWPEVASVCGLLRYLSAWVERRGWGGAAHVWDFVNLTLCSVLASVSRAPRTRKSAMVCRSVLEAALAADTFAQGVTARCERDTPSPHVAALPAEWRDVFAPELYAHALHLARCICEESTEKRTGDVCEMAVLESLMALLRAVRWRALPAPRARDLAPERLARAALGLLRSDAHHGYKYLALSLLDVVAEPLVLDDAEKVMLWSQRDEGEGGAGGAGGVAVSLSLYCEALEDILASVSESEEAEVSHPMSQSNAVGFAACALGLLRQCGLARGELVHHYAESLGESGQVSNIIRVSLALVPGELLALAADEKAVGAPPQLLARFTADPLLRAHDRSPGATVQHACCRLLHETLRLCGAAARACWSSLPARAAALLRRVVVTCVAPPLVAAQLAHLKQNADDLEDAEVTISWSRGSASCLARVDERALELAISLGAAHPLEAPAVLAPAPAPLPAAHLHHVKLYLAFQNGWLVNAFKMWTELVRSRVGRAAQCYICYCRLHPATGALPSAHCHTCHNRFHPQCLRKWFKTSKNSICPLCRTGF